MGIMINTAIIEDSQALISSLENLVLDADKCLYEAKKTGKNKIVANIETAGYGS